MARYLYSVLFAVLMLIGNMQIGRAQTFPIPGGNIALGGQACFPFTVSGFSSPLANPGMANSSYLNFININILSNHPHTLVIWVVAPNGDSLLLSAFNANGGSNYTNTNFVHPGGGAPSIVGQPAPCTGNFLPQGAGGLSTFNGQIPNGTWYLCVKDTSDTTGIIIPGGGPPANGGAAVGGSAGMGTGTSCLPQNLGLSYQEICLASTINLIYTPAYMNLANAGAVNFILPPNSVYAQPGTYTITGITAIGCTLTASVLIYSIPYIYGNGVYVNVCAGTLVNPNSMMLAPPGYTPQYMIIVPSSGPFIATTNVSFTVYGYSWFNCNFYQHPIYINVLPAINLGPNQVINQCDTSPFNLNSLFNLSGLTASWTLNGSPVNNPTAVTQSGTYILTASNPGCSQTVQVTLNMMPKPALGPDQVLDFCGPFSVNLPSMTNDPTLTYSYTIGGANVSNPASVSGSGVYQIIGTNSIGCKDTLLVTINGNALPILGPSQNHSFCEGSNVNLNSFFGLTGYTPIWTENGQPVINPSAISTSGIYDLMVVAAPGCSTQSQVILTMNPAPFLGADISIVQCSLLPFDLNSVYNTSGLIANWYLGSSMVMNPSAVSVNGIYDLIVTNSFGCKDTAKLTLNLSLPPNLGPDKIRNLCVGANLDLSTLYPSGPYSMSWTFGGAPVLNPASVNIPGTYFLIAINNLGCSDTAEVILNIINPPTLGTNQNIDFCSNINIDLSSYFNLSGLTYNWYLNGSPFINYTAVSAGGTYTLEAYTMVGCSSQATVTLNSIAAPLLGPDQNVNICPGVVIDLTSMVSASGFYNTWFNTGNIIPSPIAISTPGTYQLISVNSAGCSDTVEVTVNSAPDPNLGNDIPVSLCSGSSIDLTNLFNTAGSISIWTLNNTIVTNPGMVNSAGIYTLIATNSFGCSDTANVDLTIWNLPNPGANQNINFCVGTSVDLTSYFNISNLVSVWSLNGFPIASPVSVSTAGTYILDVTDGNGCKNQASIVLNSLSNPFLGPDQNINLCPGTVTDISNLFPTNGLNTSWSTGGNPVTNPNSVNSPGTYQLIATDANGCSNSALAIINAAPAVVLGPDQQLSICSGDMLDLTPLFNTSGYTVSWEFNTLPVSNPSVVATAGLYTLTAVNSFGCTASANVGLSLNPVPALGNDKTSSICAGTFTDISSLYSTVGLMTEWTLNGIPVFDPSMIGTAGSYQLIVTNSTGCKDTAMVLVIVNNLPTLGSDENYILCPWRTLDLTEVFNTNGLSTNWTFNNLPLTNHSAVHDSGWYQLTVTDINGCNNQASVFIQNIYCECEADFTFKGLCVEDPASFSLIADSLVMATHWSFESPGVAASFAKDPYIQFHQAGLIQVTLEANLSCGTIIIQKDIELVDCSSNCHLYIPSAFSPNDDGRNDLFKVFSECSLEEFNMQIRNRFGELVFETSDPGFNWSAENYMQGVYLYQCTYKLPYQRKKTLTGRVSLVR